MPRAEACAHVQLVRGGVNSRVEDLGKELDHRRFPGHRVGGGVSWGQHRVSTGSMGQHRRFPGHRVGAGAAWCQQRVCVLAVRGWRAVGVSERRGGVHVYVCVYMCVRACVCVCVCVCVC